MSDLMQINFWVGMINFALLVYLTIIHLKMFLKLKSGFTFSLLMFVLIFLIHNILSLYFYLAMMELYAPGTELLVLTITSVEMLAFIIFAWLGRN